jgi:CBS domain-containing protein
VADVLVEGPTSVRADSDLDGLVERMRKASTGEALVTTGQGELVGVLLLADVE